MAYVYLAAAIIFEILGTISMKYAEGFTKVVPSVLIFVCYGICFVALTIALKTLPVSMVYAIWAKLEAGTEEAGRAMERLTDLGEHAERHRAPSIERAGMNLFTAIGQRMRDGWGSEDAEDLPHRIAEILDEAAQKIERL